MVYHIPPMRQRIFRPPDLPAMAVIFLAAVSLSCERRRALVSSKPPTTAPVLTASSQNVNPPGEVALAPAPASQPSVMTIDQSRVRFPAAVLRVMSRDGKVIALLHSDDPPEAIKDQYAGNSFYFQMELDAPSPAEFAASDWRFASAGDDDNPPPYGVFLDGHRQELQPVDVKASFSPGENGKTTVMLAGKFLLVDLADTAHAPRPVSLAAELTARTTIVQ